MSSSFGADRAWDELRREARRLEGELEVKLLALTKLTSGLEGGYRSSSSSSSRHDHGSGLGPDQLAQAKASEVEALLQRLSDVNDEMGGVIGGGSDARVHTLARHRDVLLEYTQEFRRMESALGAARDRAELLGMGGEAAPLLGVQVHNASGALLRERTQLAASAGYVDDMLAQAQTVTRNLLEQRRVFDTVQDKLLSVGERFPVVNGLLNAIRRKKSKDTLVLSGTIAVCTTLILLYIIVR
ncbi:Golgi SNARE 12 protein [Monoraphidium neglectum]|uniref:Golgi SNAP receptor complex member 1 n=1 Tax=Monoraphidium neglectum TaxID=145388 RepID=A0A0D2LZ03_9CHLO|nr:Golgi SNARE 12 protein [Monoraphidium neglectum]KIY96604.1 Golgi SNARE 12 protein [Monoraphidium neglectum]|eukprot:XP_013895624.1 Golgi SNARE 12 protein [Monoraphidium neglectum]